MDATKQEKGRVEAVLKLIVQWDLNTFVPLVSQKCSDK